jgi:hypothetical protein
VSVWTALIKDKEDKQAQLWPAVLNRTRLESKTGRPTNCVSAGVQLPPPARPAHPPGRRRPRRRAHPYVAPFLILTPLFAAELTPLSTLVLLSALMNRWSLTQHCTQMYLIGCFRTVTVSAAITGCDMTPSAYKTVPGFGILVQSMQSSKHSSFVSRVVHFSTTITRNKLE